MSTDALLKEIRKLPWRSLDQLTPKVVQLHARRRPGLKPARELVLLKKIMAGLPIYLRDEYASLRSVQRESNLSSEKKKRLVELVGEIESFNVQWLGWIADLADLRGTTARELLKTLKLPNRLNG